MPITWAAAEMHDGENDDFFGGGRIQDAKWKPFQQTTPDGLRYYRGGFRMDSDCGNGPFNFDEKLGAQTYRLVLLVLSRCDHFLLSGRKKGDSSHLIFDLASRNT